VHADCVVNSTTTTDADADGGGGREEVVSFGRIASIDARNLDFVLGSLSRFAVAEAPSFVRERCFGSKRIVMGILVACVRCCCLGLELGMKYQKPVARTAKTMTSLAITAA